MAHKISPKSPKVAHKNGPKITHLSTKPKVEPVDDGTRYMVVDTKNRDREPFGKDLLLKEAKHMQSRLSSSHKCRTAKVELMPPLTPAEEAAKRQRAAVPQFATRPPVPATSTTMQPPAAILVSAKQAAANAAADAQKRHDAQKAAEAQRQRVIELATKAKEDIVELEADDGADADGDVDVGDLLAEPTAEELEAAEERATRPDTDTAATH